MARTSKKYVYAFGGGSAEGRGDQKDLLGGKGAGLAEMSGLGIPVPPGFTVTTEACIHYHRNAGHYPEGLEQEFRAHLEQFEALVGRRFGDAKKPLLLSVRSGGPVSMPGMMDTVLNLGLTDAMVAQLIAEGSDPRFVRDCYRRLVTMFGDVVLHVPHSRFERILEEVRADEGVENDAQISAAGLARVIERGLETIAEAGRPFPQDPKEQLWSAVRAVFDSWNTRRAVEYRRLHGLSEDSGTAVNVQLMVFGNRNARCATGVCFTRNPATGGKGLFGEYLVNAQGEDVVAGIRTPKPLVAAKGDVGLDEEFPQAAQELRRICETLEKHRHDMQDIEFTIDSDKLYMLQTRTGKRTGRAAVRIAADMVEEELIDVRTALSRVEPEHILQMMAPAFDLEQKARAVEAGELLGRGLPAGPGAASGRVALTSERAVEMAKKGPVVLVRAETSPDDIAGVHAAVGIVTARGGMTSHAAVVARGMGKPCIVGAADLSVDEHRIAIKGSDRVLHEGDEIALDGTTGEVIGMALPTRESPVLATALKGVQSDDPDANGFLRVLGWADEGRRMRVKANADTPHDAEVARALGAEGVGLCRTEHMFFGDERIGWMRQVILGDERQRTAALEHLLPVQQGDFEGILAAMDGFPVTIRLLDPPLHEFLPREARAVRALADQMHIDPAEVAAKVQSLAESNPMLGHRGCRLGMTMPGLYDMQVSAIVRAALARAAAGGDPRPEIMVPLVGTGAEMKLLRERIATVVGREFLAAGNTLEIPIGSMIEVPRAALCAELIAEHAEFFSFGTNDLTQMTFGFSRDDIGTFLPEYLEQGILPFDPFARIDEAGVGRLVETAVDRGRRARPHLQTGVCGEHGGDPSSIRFFERCRLDSVSCSPYRVPVARLAAARAVLGY